MQVSEIKDKKIWNEFIGSQDLSQFLQSWEWGEFQQSLGRKIWRLAVCNNSDISAAALVVKRFLPLAKSYLYCPRGPILANDKDVLGLLMDRIKQIAKKENAIFWRIELTSQSQILNLKSSIHGFQAVSPVQPKDTLILDLTKSEEELLSEMHQKTRYNIRLAERKGVKIRIMNPFGPNSGRGQESRIGDIEEFLKLLHQTTGRDKFRPHPDEYYRKSLKQFSGDFVKLYLAEYQNKVIAANIVIFFGDTATYAHGASSNEYRNVMAPHLLQWRQIQDAKRLGYKYYDFWGIASQNQKWSGITRFKKGFAGREINYPGTFDIVFQSFWYKIYRLIKRIKAPS